MSAHSSSLAWRIPWTEEPGRLQSMGLQRVRHDWATNAFFFPSVQFSSVAQSDSLRPHGMQHARLPCPSPTPRASCPSNQWCPLTILSSVIPFSSHLQSFPASIFSKVSVLHIRWPKYWSFSFSISPPNEYSELISFRMHWLDSLLSKGLSRVFSNTKVQKHQFFDAQLSL